ncbi:hypothetical protein H0H87_010236 [Tephrocybe sp. NHM501043]|nr:hypothetical protein H0H87_010236 [Tephrocybe sp. NHM501043]
MSVSAPQVSASGSRSRPQARKKPNDDASYFAPVASGSGAGAKRHAMDKADGEPRGKRKRIDPITVTSLASARKDGVDSEPKTSLKTLHPPQPSKIPSDNPPTNPVRLLLLLQTDRDETRRNRAEEEAHDMLKSLVVERQYWQTSKISMGYWLEL